MRHLSRSCHRFIDLEQQDCLLTGGGVAGGRRSYASLGVVFFCTSWRMRHVSFSRPPHRPSRAAQPRPVKPTDLVERAGEHVDRVRVGARALGERVVERRRLLHVRRLVLLHVDVRADVLVARAVDDEPGPDLAMMTGGVFASS